MFFYRLLQFLLFLPSKILFPTRVVGRKNIVRSGGVVYICNHMSNLDVLILSTAIFRKQNYISKKELYKNPFISALLKSVGAIKVDRENPGIQTIKQSLKVLKNNNVLTVFPQGTRAKDNKMQEIKGGVVMFACKTKTPIQPMWLEKKPKLFRFNKLYIGEPIYLEELYGKKLTQENTKKAEEKILNFYNKLQNEVN